MTNICHKKITHLEYTYKSKASIRCLVENHKSLIWPKLLSFVIHLNGKSFYSKTKTFFIDYYIFHGLYIITIRYYGKVSRPQIIFRLLNRALLPIKVTPRRRGCRPGADWIIIKEISKRRMLYDIFTGVLLIHTSVHCIWCQSIWNYRIINFNNSNNTG